MQRITDFVLNEWLSCLWIVTVLYIFRRHVAVAAGQTNECLMSLCIVFPLQSKVNPNIRWTHSHFLLSLAARPHCFPLGSLTGGEVNCLDERCWWCLFEEERILYIHFLLHCGVTVHLFADVSHDCLPDNLLGAPITRSKDVLLWLQTGVFH